MGWKLKDLFSRKDSSPQLTPAEWIQRGIDHTSRQEWRAALDSFSEAAGLDPSDAVAHAYCGNVSRQLSEFDAAMAAYDRALTIKPDYAEVLYNRGAILQQRGQLQAALDSFEAALAVHASFVQAHIRRGDVLRVLGQADAAQSCYRQAIALSPGNADAQFSLGVLESDAGNNADALTRFDAVIAAAPTHAGAHAGRGVAMMSMGRPQDALVSFNNAIQLKPDFARAFSNRAQAQAILGLLTDARASNDQAARLDPQDAGIHFNRGKFLSDCKEWLAAAESYIAAINLNPEYAEAHCNLGLSQQEMGRKDLALASYARALAINPRLATVFNNRGNLLRYSKQFAEAWRDYREALSLEPASAEAHYNIGQLALIQADFEIGWRGYEWRGKVEEAKQFALRTFSAPVWSGQSSLEGKRIFVYAEQGFGDTIQFCRYAELLVAQGARVTLEVQPALGDLLANLAGVSELTLAGSPVPAADYQCCLMSLPGAFKTNLQTIPCIVPYLRADSERVERWLETLGPHTQPRVGLVWSGNPLHSNDRNRSVALSQLIAYLPREFEYYCLQNQIRDADSAIMRSTRDVTIRELPLKSFKDTAALIETLDLVVTVDTSVAHLSGAMGKKTWILLPYMPDWRWLLDRNDSPWYPTMTLYRQPAQDDWHSPMSAVKAQLQAWTS